MNHGFYSTVYTRFLHCTQKYCNLIFQFAKSYKIILLCSRSQYRLLTVNYYPIYFTV